MTPPQPTIVAQGKMNPVWQQLLNVYSAASLIALLLSFIYWIRNGYSMKGRAITYVIVAAVTGALSIYLAALPRP